MRVYACECIVCEFHENGKRKDRRSSRRSLPCTMKFDNIIPYRITACASRNVDGVVRNMCIGHVRYVQYVIIIIIIILFIVHNAVVNVLPLPLLLLPIFSALLVSNGTEHKAKNENNRMKMQPSS